MFVGCFVKQSFQNPPFCSMQDRRKACVAKIKGVGPSTTLAWPGWKQPDIPVEVDTAPLETSRFKNGFAKCLLHIILPLY